jgi:sulfur-oxidizing protein SoxZ
MNAKNDWTLEASQAAATPAPRPRIRLDRKEVNKGEVVEVRALVAHVMETGLRRDASGNTIPRNIITKFVCKVAGREVFSVDFETAVSANPYLQFKFRAVESGPVELTWTGDNGFSVTGTETLTVRG